MKPLQAGGVGSGAIRVVPYDPAWPSHFLEIRDELTLRLGDLLDAVDHVGSTSVPGLAAKPKIDVDAVVLSAAHLGEAVTRMKAVAEWAFHGEPYKDGMWTFTRGRGSWGARLYLCAPHTATHVKRLLFRDWLRKHREDAFAYEALKLRLAVDAAGDWKAYTGGKSEFVAAIVGLAERENDRALIAAGQGEMNG
jgi:GrpB-like predicted nucleotidyltransferase (UPF0157 family)